MKKYFFLLFSFLLLFPSLTLAQEKPKVYFFYGEGCPHCAKEELLLDQWGGQGRVIVNRYETWHNKENADFFKKVGKGLNVNITGVPFTVVGEKTFTGFYDNATTGAQINSAIEDCEINGCVDSVAKIIKDGQVKKKEISPIEKINLPLFGEIDVKTVSLPVLSILIGAVDGFNPCAMWALVFLIGLLLSLQDKRRMAIIGTSFLITSGLFYFLILNAWLNLLVFLKYIQWIKIAIGLVGIGAGIWQIKEFKDNKEAACKVTKNEGRRKIFDRIKDITKEKSLWLALGGVVLLAISVNMVELVCSLGLPVVFTQILALAGLSAVEHYFYIFLYILFFMADDIIVFGIALFTMQTKFFSTKYSRYSGLIGGLIMLMVGVVLILKPEWLMFG